VLRHGAKTRCACARSRIADAEISSVNGTPCVTISQTEEKRNSQPLLGALSISALSVKSATKVWSFVMSGGRKVPLSSKICLLYADIPQGANGIPAPELQTGRVYSIFLSGGYHVVQLTNGKNTCAPEEKPR
jgi:hypothetical protein